MAEEKTDIQAELLNIPWFLDAKNPENIARREKLRKERVSLEDARPKHRFSSIATKPAKSVATDFTGEQKDEQKEKAVKTRPTPKSEPKARKSAADDLANKVIRVLVTDFGHKAGSKAETKSNGFRDGMIVADYMADDLGIPGKWHMGHINHCLGKGFIKLED